MIAKIMKGSDFKGVVYYILNDEKGTQIIDSTRIYRSGTDESEGGKGCRAYRIEFLKGRYTTAEQCGHGTDCPGIYGTDGYQGYAVHHRTAL